MFLQFLSFKHDIRLCMVVYCIIIFLMSKLAASLQLCLYIVVRVCCRFCYAVLHEVKAINEMLSANL